jgi:P-type Ca2+ transporter type 2C
LLALYVPWLAQLFVFEMLPLSWLGAALGLGLVGVGWFELFKSRAAGAGVSSSPA